MYNVTVTFKVKKIRSEKAALDWADGLAEHVLETFNDDESIDSEVYVKAAKVK